ncbi:MAG: hypothetical protein U5K74_12440 [Gemmatimonadaceae bacterium]|nr:hypothetical protein [Gemmatimonadaceae bacterium]
MAFPTWITRIAFAFGVSAAMLVPAARARAQVVVRPTGVNVATQSATTVFLTFDGLAAEQVATEAFWCGSLVSASPAIGLRCDPNTLFGRLPLRFDLSQRNSRTFTDIMTIPASVARRAYQDAVRGRASEFFYVRRFTDRRGGPDVFVAVTCRLTGGGATTPLSLTDVRMAFDADAAVPVFDAAAAPPALWADITYTGTGQLVGRWEVVRPGEDAPTATDLLTEATLPLDERASQRRYMQLGRVNLFLPPTGRVRVPGPDPARLPRDVDGTYLVLLRIEAGDDRTGASDASGISAGPVASAAVAGFPLPVLRYLVGTAAAAEPLPSARRVILVAPAERATMATGTRWSFAWMPMATAARYRVEIRRAEGAVVFEAVTGSEVGTYTPPPILAERAGGGTLQWRVRALDLVGKEVGRSPWRALVLTP